MADEVLERKTCQPGERFFKEGDEGNRAYVVQAGEVVIIKSTGDEDNDKAVVLGTIGKGGIFGEMALIDNQPRMASATALTGTTCVIIHDTVFHKKMQEADPFMAGLLRIFVRNIRSLTQQSDITEPADAA